jgi:polyhydroxyalkanoate synthesis regulator phasin
MAFKDAINLGLGALVLTQEKVEGAVKGLVKKGKVLESDGKLLVNELMKKGQSERKILEGKLQQIVRDSVKKLNLATKDDIDFLKKEIGKRKKKGAR